MYRNMVDQKDPLLTYSCSISPQDYDEAGNPKTFSIHAGDTGGFSSNVLKHMPVSKIAGKYLMVFNPLDNSLTIRKPE
jgi:hypothetical protein